jgi:type II secretory pathway pseudopilin PulG
MRLRSNKLGMTAIELVLSISILSLLGVGLLTMLRQGMDGWASGTGKEAANSAATVALQRLTYEIRDGRTATVSGATTAQHLTVVFPLVLTDPVSHETVYDALANDPTSRSYYVSNGNLVKNVGGAVSVLARRVTSVAFVASANTVDITVQSTQQPGRRDSAYTYTQSATGRLTLRNYH